MEVKYIEVEFKDFRWSKPIHKGWLNKLFFSFGKIRWKRRFFILNETGELFTFKDDKKKHPVGKSFLQIKATLFRISNVENHCIEIEEKKKPIFLQGDSDEEILEWAKHLEFVGGYFQQSNFNEPAFTSVKASQRRKLLAYRRSRLGDDFEEEPEHTKYPNITEIPGFDLELFDVDFENIEVTRSLQAAGAAARLYECIYQGNTLLFLLYKTRDFITKESYDVLETEIIAMRLLKHPNISQYFGCTMHPPRIGLMIKTGSYIEFIGNFAVGGQEFETFLTTQQRLKILLGIAKGMQYYQSTTQMILQDLNWHRISLLGEKDYEPVIGSISLDRRLNDVSTPSEKLNNRYYDHHIAPEYIISGNNNIISHKSDVYSFGIMLFEAMTGDFKPFGEYIEYYPAVRSALNPDHRPCLYEKSISSIECLEWIVELMKSCWCCMVDQRPDFNFIVNKISEKMEDTINLSEGYDKILLKEVEDEREKKKVEEEIQRKKWEEEEKKEEVEDDFE